MTILLFPVKLLALMQYRFLILIILCVCIGCSPRTRQPSAPEIASLDNSSALRTVARACLGYPTDGPTLRCEKVSVGAMKEMLGFSDEDIFIRTICGCSRLIPEGFPPCHELVLYQVSVDHEITPHKECFTDREGKVYIRDEGRTYLLSDLIIPHANFLPGEAINCLLATKEGQISAAVHIVPQPLEKRGPQGQTVRLEVNSQSAKSYTLIGTGFAPHERCRSLSISGDEMVPGDFEATGDGMFMMHLSPCVKGKMGGVATIQILGESMYRPIEIQYPWGKEAICQSSGF